MAEVLRREVRFEPGFDRRTGDTRTNHGIHGMQIRFLLVGEKGAAQFLLFTNWLPESTAQEYADSRSYYQWQAYLADIGYHARVPQYAEDEPFSENCPVIGGRCYYEGSSLRAWPVYWAMTREGDAAVWRALAEVYARISAAGPIGEGSGR